MNGEYAMVNDDFTIDMFEALDLPKWSASKPLSRNTDPSTSSTATKYLDVGRLEAQVVWAISHFPNGCIYDDVVRLLPEIRVHSIQPRFAPLLRKRLIIATGEKRMGISGRDQRVVKIKEQNDS